MVHVCWRARLTLFALFSDCLMRALMESEWEEWGGRATAAGGVADVPDKGRRLLEGAAEGALPSLYRTIFTHGGIKGGLYGVFSLHRTRRLG